MLFTSSTAATLAFALFSTANAHVVMTKPEPPNFGQLQNGPMGADRALCNIGGGYTFSGGTPTAAQAGSTIEVAFQGSAIHGGGACQFSVNYDTSDAGIQDKTKWKVIHTIEGGCPGEAVGNIQPGTPDSAGHPGGVACSSKNSAETECLRSYDIPIPADLKDGEAVFAWTWFNRVGNREMYMNCAPITISGGSGDDAAVEARPSIFVANERGEASECKTAELPGILGFPMANIGDTTVEYTPGQFPINPAVRNSCGGGADVAVFTGEQGATGGDSNPAPAPVQSSPAAPPSSPPAAPSPTTPAADKETPPANDGGIFADTGSPTPSPAPAAPSAPVPSSPASVPETPAPSGSAPPAGVACPTDGAIVCLPNNQWGMCDHGFAIPQGLAAGTECDNGSIAALAHRKRHVINTPLEHARRHARSFSF